MSSTGSKLVKLDFQQGIRRESTQYAETNSWYDSNNVRFRAGKPENIGGYVTKVSATFPNESLIVVGPKMGKTK